MPTSTRQDAPVFTKIHSEFETSTRADVGIGPYNEIGNCVRIRRKFPKSRCFLPNAGLQGKIRVVVGVLGGGGAAGDASEGVVAEAAAAVVAGDDAAELTDHRFIVNFPRELAIGTVAVDLLSEQHGKPPLFSFVLPPIIHAFRANCYGTFCETAEDLPHKEEVTLPLSFPGSPRRKARQRASFPRAAAVRQ